MNTYSDFSNYEDQLDAKCQAAMQQNVLAQGQSGTALTANQALGGAIGTLRGLAGTWSNPRNDPNDEHFGSHLNESGITPCGYKILVEIPMPHDLQHAEDSGLVLPDTAKDRYTNAAVAAKVIQLGKECYLPERFPCGPWCKPGDWIVMSPYSGTRIKSVIMGKVDYRFINEDTVEGIIPGPDYVERGNF